MQKPKTDQELAVINQEIGARIWGMMQVTQYFIDYEARRLRALRVLTPNKKKSLKK